VCVCLFGVCVYLFGVCVCICLVCVYLFGVCVCLAFVACSCSKGASCIIDILHATKMHHNISTGGARQLS